MKAGCLDTVGAFYETISLTIHEDRDLLSKIQTSVAFIPNGTTKVETHGYSNSMTNFNTGKNETPVTQWRCQYKETTFVKLTLLSILNKQYF